MGECRAGKPTPKNIIAPIYTIVNVVVMVYNIESGSMPPKIQTHGGNMDNGFNGYRIVSKVGALLRASGAQPIELVRAGLSPGSAYAWAGDSVFGVSFKTLALLCSFFSSRLGKVIKPGDILEVECNPVAMEGANVKNPE